MTTVAAAVLSACLAAASPSPSPSSSPPSPSSSSSPEVEAAFVALGDPQAPAAARSAAFHVLATATWTRPSPAFRARHDELLRALATDPQADLRWMAIERLMGSRDEGARQLLIDGLDGQRPALVDDAKAAQLLGGVEQARPALRRLALRATGPALTATVGSLAGDTESIALFETLLVDERADVDLRGVAGASLGHTAPERFAATAPALVLDGRQPLDLQIRLITTMTFTEKLRVLVDTPAFRASLLALEKKSAGDLKMVIRRYLDFRTGVR